MTPNRIADLRRLERRLAVEVKFAEDGFGRCSRPKLRPDAPNFARDHCDGSFTRQRGRASRCSLSERGIAYWRHVPQLFDWSAEEDHRPCPLDLTYQLARNVLAACVCEDGTIETERAHALVIYDAQNPAFQPGGLADVQWWIAVRALRQTRNGTPSKPRRAEWPVWAVSGCEGGRNGPRLKAEVPPNTGALRRRT